MYGLSDEFRATLASGSLVVASVVEVFDANGNLLATTRAGLGIQASGGVVCDSTAAIRRRADFTVIDPRGVLVPKDPEDVFSSVAGHEVRLWRGLQLPTGIELVPLGVFGITTSDVTDSAGGLVIKVSADDRARRIARNRFVRPYYVQEGQNYVGAIEALISDRLPGTQFRIDPTTHLTTFQTYSEQADPWASAMDMAASIGMEVYFDIDGVCVIRQIPDPQNNPVVWRYAEGQGATLLSAEPISTNENRYSGQIVTGESTSGYAPARAEVWDDDPNSPTFVGTYGRVPNFTTSPLVLTDAQARDMAVGLFNKGKGLARQVHFSTIPNPAHDFTDVIRLTRPRAGLVEEDYALESWTVPLGPADEMPVTTRERRVA
jgi:hypothetical protein